MATQALTASAAVANTATYVSNGTASDYKAFLAADFSAGNVVRFEATSTGGIEICDAAGRRLAMLRGLDTKMAYARAADSWEIFDSPGAPAAHVADIAATGATTSTPYGYTTAAQADNLRAAVNILIAACRRAGLLKAE